MIRLRTLRLFLGLLAVTMLFAACGGGEESSQAAGSTSSSVYMLSWDAPDTTIDNTAIDPYVELDHYEIHVSEDAVFADADAPAAVVSAVDDILSDNGQIGKGILFIVMYSVSVVLMWFVVGLITTPILWIWGMVDANRSANRINKEIAAR